MSSSRERGTARGRSLRRILEPAVARARTYVDRRIDARIEPLQQQVDELSGSRAHSARETAAPLDFPALTRDQVAGAKLYADRLEMITDLGPRAGSTVVELGVGLGDFSEFLLETLDPKLFVGVDTFRMHEADELWGRPTKEIFGSRTQFEYYADRFAKHGERVVIEEGLSWEVLSRYDDGFFDLIYVDAGHDYESVKRDASVCTKKLARDGLLIFNDYIMFDHLLGEMYGIVQNVNELVAAGGWQVVGFALQQQMFCDIALRRLG